MPKTAADNKLTEIDRINSEADNLRAKDPVKAMEYANLALSKSLDIDYQEGKGRALKTIGACQIWMSENEEGVQKSLEALEIFKALNDKVNEALVNVNLGTNFYFLSDYDTSMRYYKTALDISQEINDDLALTSALNGVGVVYVAIEQYDKALQPLLEGEKLAVKTANTARVLSIQDSIAECYFNLKDYKKAINYYSKVLELASAENFVGDIAYAHHGLGRTHGVLKEFELAIEHFNKCLALRKKADFKYGLSETLIQVGVLYDKTSDTEKAILNLQKAFDIAEEINSKELVFQAAEKLSELYEKTNKLQEALKYQKIFHITKEEVRNKKNSQLTRSFELQTKVLQSQAEKQNLEQRTKELENYSDNLVLMGEIGQKIISKLNVAEIVETVYGLVNNLMDATGFGIGLLDNASNHIKFPLFIEGGEKFSDITYDMNDKNKLSVICYENGQEIIINDFDRDISKYIKGKLEHTFGKRSNSVIYLPLRVKNKIVGVITVQSFESHIYTKYHVNILRNLASYTAIALDNARLYEEQEIKIAERTKEVVARSQEVERAFQNNKLLSEIGQQITSTLDFEEIFSKLHENVNRLMDAACFGVRIYHPENQTVEYKYGIENGVRDDVVSVIPMSDDDNYTVWCIKNKKEIFINDNQKEFKKYVKEIKVVIGELPHSLIFFPIMIGENVLGAVTIQSFQKNAYKEYHLDILRSLASYIAIALENARLYEDMEMKVAERTKELVKQKEEVERTYQNAKILSDIGNDITSLLSVGEIVEKVYHNINNLMDAAGFGIGVYNENTKRLNFPLYIEGDEKYEDMGYEIDEPDRLANICFKEKREIVINDFKKDIVEYFGYVQAPLQGKVVESIIYLPLLLKDKVLGVVTVQSFSLNAYKAYHIEMLRSLAVYAAIAIDNAGLYNQMEERVEERTKQINQAYENNRLLSEIGQQITSTLNFEDIFERLHKYINQLMSAEVFSVRIYHPETDMIEYKFEIEKGVRDYEVIFLPASDESNLSGWVIRNKKDILINDYDSEVPQYVKEAKVIVGEKPESMIFLPIMLGDRILGVVTVQSFKRNAYTNYHLDILKNLASYTAIAFDNASLYETMEEKVKERTEEVVKQKDEIEKTYKNASILSQIGKDISSTFSINEIIDKVYTNLNDLMDATCFGIGVYREKSNEIVFPATIEKKKHLMPYTYSLKDADRPAVWCYTNQKEYKIDHFSEEFVRSQKVKDYQAKEGDNPESIIYVPITHNEKRIGVITVQSFKPNAYKEYHLQMVKSLSVYVAIAIDNASLYNNLEDRVRERTEELEKNYSDTNILGAISKELSSSLSIPSIISAVNKNIHQILKADAFGIGIFSEKDNLLHFNGFVENQKVLPDFTVDVSDMNRLGSICYSRKQEIVINNFDTEHSQYIKIERKPISGNDNMSVLYLPLYSNKDIIGVVTVQSLERDAYSEYIVSLMRNLCVSIGIALDNATLYENLEEKVAERTQEVTKQKEEIEKTYENTRLLGEIGKEISGTLSIEGIITSAYEHVNRLMDASAFGIGMYREEENDLYHPCIIEKGKKLPPFSYPLDIDRIAIRCFKENKELVINDWINEHKKYTSSNYTPVQGESPQSVIYLPLTLKEKTVGVLSVQSFKTNAYSDYHLSILRNLSVYIAGALENANLYQSLEDRVEKRTEEIRIAYENTRLLSQIAEDISSSLSVETIISKVYENVNKILKAECFGIGLIDAENEKIEFKGFVEKDQLMDDFSYDIKDENRLASLCLREERDILISDFSAEYQNYIKGIQKPVSGKDSHSIIYLPLYSKEKPVGVLTVQSFDSHAYSEYHLNVLKGIAVSVGIALDNASLYQNLEEKVNERTKEVVKQKEEIEKTFENTRLLSQIGKDITSTLSIAEIIEKVHANVNSIMDATGFGIGVYNAETESIDFPAYIEGEEKFEAFSYDKKDMNRLTNVCYYKKKEIVINDFHKEIYDYIENYTAPLRGDNVESLIYLPLLLNEKPLGVITVQSFKKDAYTDYHVQMLKNLAVYVAIAIDNASLYQNMEQRVIERTQEVTKQKEKLEKNFNDTKLIAQITKVITSSLNIETIVSMAYENINSLMSAESFGIGMFNQKLNSLQFPGFIERSVKMPYFEFSLEDKERFAVWCFDNEKEILINDLHKEYNKYITSIKAPVAGETPLSIIYMPLFSKDKKIGVITVQSFSKNAYSEYQLNILRNLANSVAIAIDNATIYESLEDKVKERTEEVSKQKSIIEAKNKDITDSIQYAKKIQLALMTETNLFNTTFKDSFVYFKPKDIVSGDFYWANKKEISVVNAKGELETQELIYLAVCDSTGHGVPGAFMSLLNISFLNEAVNDKNISAPNEVFNYVREKLIKNISKEGQKDGFDGTILCLNKSTGELTYAAAYNPPLLISGDKIIELASDRMPVGHGEKNDPFKLNNLKVNKGDRLYMFTDGYADQFGGPRGKKFMYKKFYDLILSVSNLALNKQAEVFGEKFEDWKGNLEQIDDVCIIGLKF
ncbi:MAG: GAF domain-containing protein [Bacteroidia bacterium]